MSELLHINFTFKDKDCKECPIKKMCFESLFMKADCIAGEEYVMKAIERKKNDRKFNESSNRAK